MLLLLFFKKSVNNIEERESVYQSRPGPLLLLEQNLKSRLPLTPKVMAAEIKLVVQPNLHHPLTQTANHSYIISTIHNSIFPSCPPPTALKLFYFLPKLYFKVFILILQSLFHISLFLIIKNIHFQSNIPKTPLKNAIMGFPYMGFQLLDFIYFLL